MKKLRKKSGRIVFFKNFEKIFSRLKRKRRLSAFCKISVGFYRELEETKTTSTGDLLDSKGHRSRFFRIDILFFYALQRVRMYFFSL